MFFSIIVPNYNCEYLGRAISSVLNQKYKNWELIVIDNNSKSDVKSLVDSFKNKKIKLFFIHNKGIISKSRNMGIMLASYKWICFLDSDDHWKNEKLLEIKKFIEEKKINQGMIYHGVSYSNKSKEYGVVIKNHSKELKRPFYQNLLINGNLIAQSSVTIDKESLLNVSNYDEDPDKFSWEDYDLWLRLAKKNYNFFYINKNLGYIWVGQDRVSNKNQSHKNILKFLKYYRIDINQMIIKKKNYFWAYDSLFNYYFSKKNYNKAYIIFKKFNKKNFKNLIKFFFIKIIRFYKKI